MEELKLLVDMVASLPEMALWVVGMFFAYKMSILASIYGTIRFVATKCVEVFEIKRTKNIELRTLLDGVVMGSAVEPLMAQLHRLRTYNYVHTSNVDWLREAIDDKVAKDILEKQRSSDAKTSK